MESEFLSNYRRALHGDPAQNQKDAKYVDDFLRENGDRPTRGVSGQQARLAVSSRGGAGCAGA